MNNSEWLRSRLLERCGIPPEPARRNPALAILRERERSDRFESLMRNRHKVDTKRYLGSIARRLEAYRASAGGLSRGWQRRASGRCRQSLSRPLRERRSSVEAFQNGRWQ